jgi:protein-S-isoprenylcysteine O-methyltransferase Ste14
MTNFDGLLLTAFSWALYGVAHSWLAGERVKAWVARSRSVWGPAYRLIYNGLALVLLIPPLWATAAYGGEALWHWPAWIAWPATVLTVSGFVWSLKWYDSLDFIGLRQWRGRHARAQDAGRFVLSPLHRYVRHPWYSLGLLFIWTRDLNAAWLVASLAVTVYVVIGSRLEERKLIAAFGESYVRYRERVPGLIPWPGRHLDTKEARALEQK